MALLVVKHLKFISLWCELSHFQSSAHDMAERVNIEDFFREFDPGLSQYAYAFHESEFTFLV